MESWNEKGRRLNTLIRPTTFPVAVKLYKSASDFPDKVRRPKEHLGIKIPVCQGLSMARMYGWTVGMTGEDSINCAGRIVFGWRTPNDEENLMNGWVQAGFMKNTTAAKKTLDSIYKFQEGEYEGLVMSPLERTKIEPDLIMVYCNPAQIIPLTHSTLYKSGGRQVFSSQSAVASCSDGIVQTILKREPSVVLPGIGDRTIAMTRDDELIFAIPAIMLDDVLAG
ncbi:MAG: DUF169 domain-containing protein, partial [Thermodesulfobacteriota bacterium]|nr:DUF169 domain-containing protein [Thermodesulfobacteriota bacterium]